MAATKHERALVEAAYQVLTEDAEKLGFTYSGFALTSLPHKPQRLLLGPGVMGAHHATRAATRAPRRALPRRRALCTNSKKPR
jgi:hypothetical protein